MQRPSDEAERLISLDCERNKHDWQTEWWKSCGISPRHRRAVSAPMNPRGGGIEPILNRCQDFAAKPSQSGGIYLFGGVGCGKTLIASKMLRMIVARISAHIDSIPDGWRYPVPPPAIELKSVPALLSDIRGTFNGGGSSTALINRYAKLSWLAMDDVGAEKPSEWVCDVLFQVIDERYGMMLPTIFTSNLSLEQLSERLSERIADRILEMCRGNVIEITVGSYRG